MYTSGLMKRFVSNYEATYTPDCNPGLQSRSIHVINMTDVIFAFYGLIYGSTFALLLSIAELVWRKYLKHSQLNCSKVKGFVGGINNTTTNNYHKKSGATNFRRFL
jgi:hypothetical protein